MDPNYEVPQLSQKRRLTVEEASDDRPSSSKNIRIEIKMPSTEDHDRSQSLPSTEKDRDRSRSLLFNKYFHIVEQVCS